MGCPLCGGERVFRVSPRSEPRHVVCRRCGLVRRDPLPAPAAANEFYESHYYEERGYSTPPDPERLSDRNREIVAWTAPHLGSGSTVLEIGCSDGEYLAAIRAATGAGVIGVEPSRSQAKTAAATYGLTVHQAPWEAVELDAPVDLVVMTHVLEHLYDTDAALRRVHAVLSPDGLLIVEVPNIRRPNPAKRLSRWLTSEHLYYFSPATLAAFLGRAGFDVERQEATNVVRMLARRACPSTVEPPREAGAVVRALLTHEVRYWPGYVRRRIAG